MVAIACNVVLHIWILDHVGAQESWQTSHTQEFVGFMEMHVQTINALTVEELFWIVESFLWRIPSQRQHVLFTLNQAARTVFFARV